MLGGRCLRFREHLVGGLPAITGFLDATMIYVLSKEWSDLLSIYLPWPRLKPIPYCEQDITRPCTDPKPAWESFLFALMLLPLCTLVVQASLDLQQRTGWAGVDGSCS